MTGSADAAEDRGAHLEIERVGPGALLQDLGRPGYAALGVPRSGAFDRAAARLANRLVGNDDGATLIEVLLGGLQVHLRRATTLALTGAACEGTDWGRALTLPAGTVLRLPPPSRGLRSYLAIRGGLRAVRVLGSCSTDTLSGLGPAPLRAGQLLATGAAPTELPAGDGATPPPRGPNVLVVRLGPRADWFSPEAHAALTGAGWVVRPDSDRVGVRLAGPDLPRARPGELTSEPTRPGAIQVTPGGPILFGPDGPVTGGYPVIAVTADGELDRAAQLRPGDVVRLSSRAGA